MSRTCHTRPFHSLHYMRVQNRRKSEEAALDELKTENVPFRHINRLSAFWTIIPDPWDDKPHASWSEFHNKHVNDSVR